MRGMRLVAKTGRRPLEGRRRLGILLFVLALLPRVASAGLSIQLVGRGEGLPSTQVHAVIEDGDGFVWFAGPSGLARYDGWRVVTFDKGDGLSSHGLRSLALDHDRRLWVGTDVGVDVREHDGRIRPLAAPEEWRHGFVDAMAAGPEGTMWLATARGLLRWSENAGLRPADDPRLAARHVASVAVDAAGRVWAAVPSIGLLRGGNGGSWTRIELSGMEGVGTVRTVATSPRGGLLVGGDQGLAELDAAASTATAIGEASDAGLVSAVLETEAELWLGRGGELRLLRREAGRWRSTDVAIDTGLINAFTLDRLGNLWAATDKLGAAKVSVLRRAVRSADAPCQAQVFAIARDVDDAFLVGGDQCSWVSSGDGRVRRRLAGLDQVKVWDLVRDRGGTLWAATENGLYRGSTGAPMAPAELDSETLSAPGRVLLERGDALWVGTVTGLVAIDGGRVGDRLDAGGRPLGYVYTLREDSRDRLWAGTIGNGLWRETADGRLERVRSRELTDDGNVYSIAFGPRGEVAIAQDDRLVTLEGDDSALLPNATGDAVAAWSLLFDLEGRLWAGGSSGLVRYDLDAHTPALRLTSTMGLSGEEFTTSRSLTLTGDGRLLCGLDGGLSIVDPDEIERFRAPPRVRLLDVAWTDAELDAEALPATVVREGRWTLDVAVAAPWFVDEKSLTYRHRARGFDRGWSSPQPGGAHLIHYTGLPAGTYTLEAQAHSPLVGWGPADDLMTFRVAPPWWRSPWALAAAFALAGSGVAALWRWRTRRLRDRGRELERQIATRTEELRQALAEQQHIAAHDELTGLPNQRAFWEQAHRHQALATRHGTELSLVVLDLDEFKRVNDTHGHRAGDRLLAAVARRLLSVARDSDLLARYGGEEFVVLMPETAETEASRAAERLRAALAQVPFTAPDGGELTVTASFGVACLRGPDDDIESLFRRADGAVYLAKETKNAVARAADGAVPAAATAASRAPDR